MSFGSHRFMRVLLLKVRQSSPCLAWARKRAQRLECRGLERGNESRFRLLNADGRLIIWRQAHVGLDSSCQV
ncbi:hypothetical protein TNCV_304391 [Trichonephila clavipes]|nr:hypothetical protein TNCV_304391 [Trichonephila clavipes]